MSSIILQYKKNYLFVLIDKSILLMENKKRKFDDMQSDSNV
jgi:hypothetical protein